MKTSEEQFVETMKEEMRIIQVQATVRGGEICSDLSYSEIHEEVMKGNLIILKNVYDAHQLLQFRKLIFEWGQLMPPQEHGVPLPQITNKNFHRIDDNPTKSTAPHIYHAFVFNHPLALDPVFKAESSAYFDSARRFQNQITGNKAEFSPTTDPIKLRPEIIQYPVGGGFFAKHEHSLDPQKIGMIVSLSSKGVDFQNGGTEFELSGKMVSIENDHDIGDIALFRYDIPHCVTPVDENENLDWHSEKGRWTMILPYH